MKSEERGRFKVGFWFLIVGIVIIAIVAADMFIENAPKGNAKLLSKVTIDGKITPGEYPHHFFDKKIGYKLYWRVSGGNIYFGIHSPKKGWVAVGLGAKKAMHDADIYIAYVKNGKTHISEQYGNTPYSHIPIKSMGEKSVIEKYAGTTNASGTSVEFERPLQSTEKHIKSIKKKSMRVIFAFSNVKDFTTYHGPNSRGETEINFFANNMQKKKSGIGMWVEDLSSYQIGGITWGILFLMVAFIAFVTGWIEGNIVKPIHIKKDKVGSGPFIIIGVLGVLDIFFIIAFIVALFSKTTPTMRGLLISVTFFILSFMVALYRHYYINEDVTMHEMDDELPW